jgi:hypothetical protein
MGGRCPRPNERGAVGHGRDGAHAVTPRVVAAHQFHSRDPARARAPLQDLRAAVVSTSKPPAARPKIPVAWLLAGSYSL